MQLTFPTKILLIGGCCFTLLACGGSSDGNRQNPPGNSPDYSKLRTTGVITTELKQADAGSLGLHLKNGLRLKVRDSQAEYRLEAGSPAPALAPEADNSFAADNYSETNTHVVGVDEADYLKYDGDHIFASSHPQWYWEEQKPDAKIRIFSTDPTQASAEEVGSINVADDDHWGAISELYLIKNSTSDATTGLATLRSSWSYFAWIEPAVALIDSYFVPWNDQVEVTIYDVSTPAEPEHSWQISIDGYVQESRKIDNILYLVVYYSPWLAGLEYYPETNAQKKQNESLIQNARLNDLLPSYRINGGSAQPLVQPGDCYLPVDAGSNDGFSGLTSLVAIDLDSKQIRSSVCLNANVQGIYASLENFYIGASSAQGWWFDSMHETILHKFAIQDGNITYRSTGKVPGFLGWDDPAFRMSEHDGYFRIVTTSRDSNGNPKHQLTVLQDSPNSDQMQTVASLPNANRPSAIGKPGEDIYSVRFRDERAYIVTFQRIDPLYVLDLGNPQDPFVAGELEVPGFSSYLHPINDDYLLGIGNEVTDNINDGVKVSLYDVSDSANPLEITSLVLGERGTYSEALYDLHALSFLSSTDQLRFTLPIHSYSGNYEWSHSGLHLFEINGLSAGEAALTHVGEIVAEESSPDQNWPGVYDNVRSVLHDDAVYFMYGDKLFSAFWSSPQAANGPL